MLKSIMYILWGQRTFREPISEAHLNTFVGLLKTSLQPILHPESLCFFFSNAAKLLILKMFVLVEFYLLKYFGHCVVMLSNSNIAVVQFCFSLL